MSDPSQTPSEQRRYLRPVPRGWYVLVPAAALLVGILLGALVMGVVGDNDQPEDADREPTNPPTPTAGTGVVVPDDCLAAADTAEEIITTLQDGIGAIRQFQEDRIRATLDELEDLEARARRQAAACRGTSITDVPGAPTDSTPSPTTVPSTPTATESPS